MSEDMSDSNSSEAADQMDSDFVQNYPKDCFLRFGDDLCQHLMTFMALKDKIRLLLVSKDWYRCLTGSQITLEVIHNPYHCRALVDKLRPMVKTFVNITDLEINSSQVPISGELLRLIADYCPKLRSFIVTNAWIEGLTYDHIKYFGDKIGKHLVKLKITFSENEVTDRRSLLSSVLDFTPNLKDIHLQISLALNEELINKYNKRYLKSICLSGLFTNESEFHRFVTLFGSRLERVVFSLISSPTLSVKSCLKQLSRITTLKVLSLRLNINAELTEKLDNSFLQMATDLKHLETLRLEVVVSHQSIASLIDCKWFDILAAFKTIKSLRFALIMNKNHSTKNFFNQFIGGFESFKDNKRLKNLCLVFEAINDELFNKIGPNLPHLQSFQLIYSQCVITDRILHSLAKIPALLSIRLVETADYMEKWCTISDVGVDQLLEQSLRISTIEINCFSRITELSVQEFISRALLAPDRKLFIRFKDESHIIEYIESLDIIPRNLDLKAVDNGLDLISFLF